MSAVIIVLLCDLILHLTLKLPFRYDSPKRFLPIASINPFQEDFKDLFTQAASY